MDLEPFSPYDFDTSGDILEALLPYPDDQYQWMVCTPSFAPLSVIAIIPPGFDVEEGRFKEHPPDAPWTIKLVREDRQRRNAGIPDYLTRRELKLTPEAAVAVSNAWQSVVLRTRYPDPGYVDWEDGTRATQLRMIMDGTVWYFRSGRCYGRTHSPDEAPANQLTRFAEEIQRTVLYPSDDQIKALVDMARAVQSSTDALPW